MKRALVAAVLAAFATTCAISGADAAPQSKNGNGQAPRYVVDPFWPKPLPENWMLGQVAGVAVDSQDNVWILHRPASLVDDEKGAQKSPPETRCCIAAPPVLQFSPDGRLLRKWGGPGAGYEWPKVEHGIHVDKGATSGSAATTRATTRSSNSPPTANSCSRSAKRARPAAPTVPPSSAAPRTW